MRLSVKAFAKINVGLKVLYKRPDNYHELRTIFQTISLADSVTVEWRRARKTKIILDDPLGIPDNLMVKAARLILDETRTTGIVTMTLRKRIPLGGGMGGGSTDAAAVLRGLPALIGRRIESARLADLAVQLGADVPFFLLGGTALGLGRGEELYTLPDLPQTTGVLVSPRVHVSTAEAFRTLAREPYAQLTSPVSSRILGKFQVLARSVAARRSSGECAVSEWTGLCENDFEPAVFRQHPNLKKIKRKLVRLGATPALMTGSGAALYGFFGTRRAAEAARQTFSTEQADLFTLVSRRRYAEHWRAALAAAGTGVEK